MNNDLLELGAKPLIPLQFGNENSVDSDFGSLVADFNMWKRNLIKLLARNQSMEIKLESVPSTSSNLSLGYLQITKLHLFGFRT